MNSIKNNFENQIKKQIEEREIAPSRDLWSEIENQKQNDRPRSRLNWILIAACLILICSLGAVLVFYNKPGHSDLQVAKKDNPPTDVKKNTVEIIRQSPVLVTQDQKEPVAIKDTKPVKKTEISETPGFPETENNPIIKEDISGLASNITDVSPAKIIAKTDSSKTSGKRKRYVDPSTLLFSVEHKDVIEKTKDKSNVATIDLNGR
jgi:hypothetical protein